MAVRKDMEEKLQQTPEISLETVSNDQKNRVNAVN